jgi:hypothetical protein
VNRTEHTANIPSTRTGLFAVLPASRRGAGTGARPVGLAALAVCAVALVVLALAPVSASASAQTFCLPGSDAGQCAVPSSVAVDQTTGTVYVAETNNYRISEFDSAGHFIRVFGVGVLTGANEPQACTSSCRAGLPSASSTVPGAIEPVAVAVDQSSHEIYVVDSRGERVEKFTPAGEFVLMFGKEVNKTKVAQFKEPGNPHGITEAEESVCAKADIQAGDTCGFGVAGSGLGTINTGFFGRVLSGAALDVDSSGNVWFGDKNRLERFSSAGVYLSEVPLPGVGIVGSLAFDTDLSSPSFGDFYVSVPSVHEWQTITIPVSGTYTLTFEGQTTTPIKGVTIEAGALGAFEEDEKVRHEIQEALEALPAVGPGNVTVGGNPEEATVTVEFVHALGAANVPQIIASAGSVVTTEEGVHGKILKFDPSGVLLQTLDASGHPKALALDPASGDLFVSDQFEANPATLLEYDPSGSETEAFGFGEVLGEPQGHGLAFGATAQRLYSASNSGPPAPSGVQVFTLPPPGPLPGGDSAKANEIKKTAATLCTGVNPEGKETTYRFQYIIEAKFKADGNSFGAGTLETSESGSVGADFAAHEACQAVSGLVPATAYRFRLFASNENAQLPGGIDGETAEFTTLPPAAIDSSTVSAVTAESATLQAELNPLGDATSYHFEYLTEAAYLHNEEVGEPLFTGAARAPLVDAPVGAGFSDVSVSQHLQGLASHTTYRYRTVVENAVSEAFGGPFASPAHAFTTQGPVSVVLPDGRGWELVSPPDKRGGLIGTLQYGQIQTAPDGGAFAFVSSTPTEGEPPGSNLWNQVLAVRGGVGSSSWSDRTINSPHKEATGLLAGTAGEYILFSSDLSQAALQPEGPFDPELSAEASEQTAYLRTNFLHGNRAEACLVSCYRPLVTGAEGFANVPSGTVLDKPVGWEPQFRGATPDLSHVVIESGTALTAVSLPHFGLYEWSAAAPAAEQLRLITVLPSGQAAPGQPGLGWSPGLGRSPVARNAISADGSRVVWSGSEGNAHLYLRYNASEEQSSVAGGKCSEPGRACTIQLDTVQGGSGLGEAQPHFQAASVDDSVVFFTDTQNLTAGSGAQPGRPDLYRCQIVVAAGGGLECRLSDLTPPGLGGEPAALLGTVPGASADGSYVYFVANGVLASGGSPGDCAFNEGVGSGSCNLYLDHEGTTIFLASLAGADYPAWNEAVEPGLAGLTSRVSPNGRWLAFMSERPLTGYDSRDARTGRLDDEVFLYHAGAGGSGGEGKLVCASCNPTGARPRGEEYAAVSHSGVDGSSPWPEGQGIAASVPSWMGYQLDTALYQPRYLSDSGRLFFNSFDSLVSTDTNGAGDVYQYEPPQGAEAPPADTCNSEAPTYSPAAGGCIDLISSGTSAEESGFLDASESGSDVFFFTNARLSPADVDSSRDVYDAHVCSAEFPCPPPPPPPPPACQGDACQSPVQAPDDPTPGSLTFSGLGNLPLPAPVSAKSKAKPLTRAQKLSGALKVCRKKPRKKRPACEKQARRAYGPAGKAKKSNRRGK